MRMDGRRVLLTAATGESGAAIALLLAQEGARLALTSRRVDGLTALVKRIQRQGGYAAAIEANPIDHDSIGRAASQAADVLGGLDGAVYNVGGFVAGNALAADTSIFDWEQMLRQHLQGAFFTLRAVVPHLIEAGGGSAVVIGAARAARQRGNVSYAVAKGALVPLVEKVAREYRAQGLRVNLVQPRSINESPVEGGVAPVSGQPSDQAKPEDVAYACLFLLSTESRMVTGQVLTMDGGRDL